LSGEHVFFLIMDHPGPWGNGRQRGVSMTYGELFQVSGEILAFAGGCDYDLNHHSGMSVTALQVQSKRTHHIVVRTYQSPFIYQAVVGSGSLLFVFANSMFSLTT
jgi:hypothetical protein